jgi:hypothetical protein
MTNNFYEEILLKEEFRLIVKLQQNAEFSKYVSVSYEDRGTVKVQRVAIPPSGPRYPEKYIVEYRMPVYVSRGQLRQDWHGTATMLLSETVLTNKHSHQPPHVTFHSNFTPLNNHVKQDWICVGNAWDVARDHGIWHFILSLGATINQDAFVTADSRWHLSEEAYKDWVARNRMPVTDIKWPLNLLDEGNIVMTRIAPRVEIPPAVPQKQQLTITKMSGKLEIKAKTASSPIVFTQKKQ